MTLRKALIAGNDMKEAEEILSVGVNGYHAKRTNFLIIVCTTKGAIEALHKILYLGRDLSKS